MSAPARRPATRAAVLRFYHLAEWFIVAIVGVAVIMTQPDLVENLNLYGVAAAWFVCVAALSRMRWPIRNESARLLAGFVLMQFGIAAVVFHAAPILNGLLIAFVVPTTTAWLLLSRDRALAVMLLASGLGFAVTLSFELSAFNLIYASVLCISLFLTARLVEIAIRAAASAEAEAVASRGRDELTQIPARHAFLRHAERWHAAAVESRIPYAIELIDINNLRSINDTYGFAAGDRAIVVAAQALARLRATDEFLARYDGDKFVMLVPRLDGDRADDLAKKIRSAIFSTTIDVDTEVVRIKANVGIARFPIAGVTLNALISAAERDMKLDQQGRDRPAGKPVFRRRSGKMSA